MTDVVKRLRSWAPIPKRESQCGNDIQDAADEIERLRAQNAILTDAINAASQIMASAPAWHAMHREAIEQLQRVRKEMEP